LISLLLLTINKNTYFYLYNAENIIFNIYKHTNLKK